MTTWGGREKNEKLRIVDKFLELCKDIPLAKKSHEGYNYMLKNDFQPVCVGYYLVWKSPGEGKGGGKNKF